MIQKREKTTGRKTGTTRNGKKRLGASEVELFKQMLLEKRRVLVGDVHEMEDETLKKSRTAAAGDLSSMPIHMADLGSDTYAQEFALGLMDSERKLLKKIDGALERIALNTYGICEGTGKIINEARLKAKPWAKYSVDYARMLEKGGAA